MKNVKKILSLLLVLVMVLAIGGLPAFAAQSSNNTITINNAKAGETYSAYKMLELSVNDTSTPTAYRYTVASDWANFFADSNSSVWGTVLEKDSTGTYFQGKEGVSDESAWSATSDLSKFAEAAAKYAENLTPESINTPTGTTAILNTTEAGYYLVTSTLGTRAMIDTTPGDVAINEKNSEDTIKKTVKENSNGSYGDANDAQIGDTVEFKSVATIVPRSIKVKIHDTMDPGLTLNTNSIAVYSEYDENNQTLYEDAIIRYSDSTKGEPDIGDTFTIDIPDSFAATASSNQELIIIYTAEVNSNAIVKDDKGVAIVDQHNRTRVQFGEGTKSQESFTETTTHKFTVHKYATDIKYLAGAIFQVKKDGVVVNLKKLDEKNYRVVDDTETTTPITHVAANNEVATVVDNTIVRDFVTVDDGDIVIWGVDSGNNYTIEEIQAPKVYNILNPSSVNVKVDDNNSTKINVENNAGTELPSTGGMGTTIFYVVGGILVVFALVLLITKRRMKSEE